MSQPRESDRDLRGLDWSIPFVLWGSVAQAALGATYLVALAVGSLGGTLVYPPPDWLQTVAALATLGEGPLLVIVIAGLGASAGSNKRALAVIAVCFTSLFALSVSINRFSQLGVIRQSAGHGSPRPGIDWFLPYGADSIMLGLEYLGWGWFLGLGMIFAAGLVGRSGLDRAIRVIAITYGVLGIAASAGFLIPNAMSVVGFVAWGPMLLAFAVLLVIRSIAEKRRLGGKSPQNKSLESTAGRPAGE